MNRHGRVSIPSDMIGDVMREHSEGSPILHATLYVGDNLGDRSITVAMPENVGIMGGPAMELLLIMDAAGMLMNSALGHVTDRIARWRIRRAYRTLGRAFERLARDLPDAPTVPDTPEGLA